MCCCWVLGRGRRTCFQGSWRERRLLASYQSSAKACRRVVASTEKGTDFVHAVEVLKKKKI